MLTGPILALRGALAAVAPEVSAPPDEPRLEWIAPPQCPDASDGTEHLVRFLGERGLPAPAQVKLTADVSGYVALVTVAGATRTLQADDCETLARAAALVVVVSLDPMAAAEVMPRSQREVSTAEADVEPDAPPAAVTPVRPDRRRPEPAAAPLAPSLWFGASGGIALAIVPSLTGAVRLGSAMQHGAFRLQSDLTYATPRTITYPAEPGVGGRFQSVVIGMRACFAPATGRVSVPLCGGLEGGAIFGHGIGIANTRNPVGLWLGGLVSAATRVRVHPRIAIMAGADLLAALWRPAFHAGAHGTLFRTPPVGLRAMAGLEVRLR